MVKIDGYDQRPIGYGYGQQPNINFGFTIGLRIRILISMLTSPVPQDIPGFRTGKQDGRFKIMVT